MENKKVYEITKEHDMKKLMDMLEGIPEDDIVFKFTKDVEIYRNANNLQILSERARALGKDLTFDSVNAVHRPYLQSVNDNTIEGSETQIDLNATVFKDNDAYQAKKRSVLKDKLNPRNMFKKFNLSFKNKNKKDIAKSSSLKDAKKKRVIIISVVSAIVLLALSAAGTFAFYWYVPKAVVKINVDSDIFVKLLEVEADENITEVNLESAAIPAFSVVVEQAGELEAETTGEAERGEKSEGEITIFNKRDKEIKIDEGDKFEVREDKDGDDGDKGLIFIAKEDVTIEAQTEEKEESEKEDGTPVTNITYTPGKGTIKVRAENIGGDYNLSEGYKFKVRDYDYDEEAFGVNESKIKGGSQEKVKVVTEQDQTELRNELEDQLQEKALEAMQQKVVEGQSLKESSVVFELVNPTFSNEIDEEAENLKLTMSIRAKGLAYSDEDLDTVVSELVKEVVPEDFNLNQGEYEYDVKVLEAEGDGKLILQIKLRTFVTPRVDLDEIKKDLIGLNLKAAKEYLSGIRNIKEYKVLIAPDFVTNLPRREKNLQIEVSRDF